MSNLEPPHTPGEHDPFAELELFEMDPKVRGILTAMRQAQTELQTGTMDRDDEEYASRVGCGKLNSYLMDLDLLNDSVSLYGKVRLAPWLDEEDKAELLADPFFLNKGLHRGSDHRGEYWQLADHQLRVSPIDTDRTEDEFNPVSYVMTLRTEHQARLIEEEQADPSFAGGLMMYPDDVEYLRPSTLSDRYMEQLLMTNYPDLYAQIIELLPGDGWYDDNETEIVTDALALERLTRLKIPASLSLPAEFRESLGAFLLNRMTLDQEAGHVFENYKSIRGLDDDGTWVPHKGKARKLRGNVIAIDIDAESHELSYIITELARDPDGGIELRKLPARQGLRVRSARPVNKRFGKAAMWQFDSDEHALQWYRARDKGAAMPEIEQFVRLVEDVDPGEFGIREQSDRFEVSIDDDLARLRQEFKDHYDAFCDMAGDEGLTPDNTQWFPSLEKQIDQLDDVAIGSQLVFTRDLTVGFPDNHRPDHTISTAFFESGENMALRGTVVDFRGAWFDSPKQGQPSEFALAAVVGDPAMVPNNDSNQIAPLAADVVMVRIDDEATKAHLITYKVNMGQPHE